MTPEEFDFIYQRTRSLQEFEARYPTPEACYEDYAVRLSERFSQASPSCVCCGSTGKVEPHVAQWFIRYQNLESQQRNYVNLLFAFFGGISVTHAHMRFQTRHTFCRRCLRLLSLKRGIALVLSFLATLASYLPPVVAVFTSLYILFNLALGDNGKMGSTSWVVLITSIVCIPVFLELRHQADLLLVPKPLRPIAKKMVVFDKLTPLSQASVIMAPRIEVQNG